MFFDAQRGWKENVMANIVRRNERYEREVAPPGRSSTDPSYFSSIFDPFRMMGGFMRWDPFSERETVRGGPHAGAFLPKVDVRESPDTWLFRVDLPGVNDEDVELSLTSNRLTISGQRQEERRDEREKYHSHECSYGNFSRSFTLPEGADPYKVDAAMKEGVLTVTVPKRAEVKPRRISIRRLRHGGNGGKKHHSRS
jgi:HSP20 family protein